MKTRVEYAVLGGGIIGSATAYLLAREGKSVALVEQFNIGHNRGSSHGESRITRLSYDHPVYIRMAKRTFQLWSEIEAESRQQLYFPTGGIDIGFPDDPRIEQCRTSMDAENVPYEELDRAEILRRFPQFSLGADAYALVQESTGILSASLCVQTLADLAVARGAIALPHTTVNGIEFQNDHVILQGEQMTVAADNLLVCAGAWAGPLLHKLGISIPLTVTLEQWAFFAPEHPDDYMPGRFPIFIQYDGAGSGGIGWYGFPIFGAPGVKTAVHRSGPATTAEGRTFEPDAANLATLQSRMKAILPGAAGDIIQTGTCLYTNTPDHHFVIDLLPNRPNVAFFTGCSGHAFKFAPVIAEMLIGLLQGREPSVPMAMFNASRVAKPVPLPS